LVIYRLPYHPHATRRYDPEKRRVAQLWNDLVRLYAHTQPKSAKSLPTVSYKFDLESTGNCSSIELRTMPVTPQKVQNEYLNSGVPLMRTYSALGILKNAAEQPYPRIAFIDSKNTPGFVIIPGIEISTH
jgi:hypothetical protein